MSNLPKEYSLLFNGISATISEMETLVFRLKELQLQAEEAYMQQQDATSFRETKEESA